MHDRLDAELERLKIKLPRQAQGHSNIVGRRSRLEPIYDPKCLLVK